MRNSQAGYPCQIPILCSNTIIMLHKILSALIQIALLVLGLVEFVIAVIQLPRVIEKTNFFDIRSDIALLVFLLAAGFLPVGITKALMQRPTGWFFLILSQIFWFGWASLSIDILQEILQTLV